MIARRQRRRRSSAGSGLRGHDIANNVARNDHLHTAIQLPASRGRVVGDGIGFSHSASKHTVNGYAGIDEVVTHGGCTLLGKPLVEFVAADAVGVSLDLNFQVRIGEHDSGDSGQAFAGGLLQSVLTGIEEHVRHADDEAAVSIFGLEHLIQLLQQASAHLFFLANRLLLLTFRLFCGLACFVGFRLSSLLLGQSFRLSLFGGYAVGLSLRTAARIFLGLCLGFGFRFRSGFGVSLGFF